MAYLSANCVIETSYDGSGILFNLKECLKLVGWTVLSSSDGSTYNSSGDQITHKDTGAGGMENAGAWYVIQDPDAHASICVQIKVVTSGKGAWRIKRSIAGFTGGSPAAGQVPSATDEQVLWGSGTDASPTYANLPGNSDYTVNIVVNNEDPWQFAVFDNGKTFHWLYSGAESSDQDDPYVSALNNSTFGSMWVSASFQSNSGLVPPKARIHHGTGSAANISIGLCRLTEGGSQFSPGGTATSTSLGAHPTGGRPLLFGYWLARANSSTPGFMGRCLLLGQVPTRVAASGWDVDFTTVNIDDGDKNGIVVGEYVLPWPGVVHSVGGSPLDAFTINGAFENTLLEEVVAVPAAVAISSGTGGFGLRLDSDTVALFHFDETDDDILPSDKTGNLEDAEVPSGLSLPTVVDGVFGNAREFASATAFIADEVEANSTRLLRSMSVEAIVSLDGAKLANGTYTIVSRGDGAALASYRTWGLRVLSSGGNLSLQMFWQRAGGTNATVTAGAFTSAEDGFLYVAAVRRWISESSVEVEYFVNGLSLGTVTSTDGDIDGGSSTEVSIGCRGSAAATYTDYFIDAIDQIRITDRARTAEEVLHTYREMFLYPAHGSELIKSYQPEGEVYSQDPDSAIQRELSVEGDMLGLVLANTINLQEYFLPDKATLTLERWEQVTRQFPLPGDTIAVRRARILGHLRKVNGFTRVDIAKAVAQILDLEEDEVVILENSNRFEDDFADATRSAAWQHVAGEGTITEGTNTLTLACQASDTPQWNEHEGGPRARFELRSGEEVEVLARMSTKTLPDDGCKLSVFIQESLNGDAHHVGLMNDGGTVKYFYEKFIDGVATETVGGAASGSALWFRIKKNDDDTVDLGYTTSTDPESFTALATGITSIGTPTIAGVALYNDGGSLSGTQNVVFTEFRTWQPRSDLVWVWYVYRDQLIAGSPDVRGAQSVVNRLKPAHTNGTVCQVEAFLAEDAESLADRDPLGGIFDV